MRILIKKRGFTLVEILLYFAVVGLILGSILTFSLRILDLSSKSENMHEIKNAASFTVGKIADIAKIADSIDDVNSIFENDIGVLSFNVSEGQSPLKFYLEEGDLFLQRSNNQASKINSDFTFCSIFRLQKLVFSKAPDQIKIKISCEAKNKQSATIDDKVEINTSVSLRKK